MVPGRPDMPAEHDPNPQSCDNHCSQSQEWGHQGCLGHFQEGKKGHYQVQEAQDNRIMAWLTVNPAGFWPQNTPTRWV